jgi:periplasmic protein TonB
MKKIIGIITLLIFNLGFSQETKTKAQVEDVDYGLLYSSGTVEVKPEFPGGIQEFYNYIGRNFYTPSDKNFKGGKIIVSFVIEKDGSVTDIDVKRDIGFGTKEETIRVLKECIKWKPAEQEGVPVRCSYMLPILLQGN